MRKTLLGFALAFALILTLATIGGVGEFLTPG